MLGPMLAVSTPRKNLKLQDQVVGEFLLLRFVATGPQVDLAVRWGDVISTEPGGYAYMTGYWPDTRETPPEFLGSYTITYTAPEITSAVVESAAEQRLKDVLQDGYPTALTMYALLLSVTLTFTGLEGAYVSRIQTGSKAWTDDLPLLYSEGQTAFTHIDVDPEIEYIPGDTPVIWEIWARIEGDEEDPFPSDAIMPVPLGSEAPVSTNYTHLDTDGRMVLTAIPAEFYMQPMRQLSVWSNGIVGEAADAFYLDNDLTLYFQNANGVYAVVDRNVLAFTIAHGGYYEPFEIFGTPGHAVLYIRTDGTVGAFESARGGYSKLDTIPAPLRIPGMSRAIAVRANEGFAGFPGSFQGQLYAAITAADDVYFWGARANDKGLSLVPMHIPGIADLQIVSGSRYFVVLTRNGLLRWFDVETKTWYSISRDVIAVGNSSGNELGDAIVFKKLDGKTYQLFAAIPNSFTEQIDNGNDIALFGEVEVSAGGRMVVQGIHGTGMRELDLDVYQPPGVSYDRPVRPEPYTVVDRPVPPANRSLMSPHNVKGALCISREWGRDLYIRSHLASSVVSNPSANARDLVKVIGQLSNPSFIGLDINGRALRLGETYTRRYIAPGQASLFSEWVKDILPSGVNASVDRLSVWGVTLTNELITTADTVAPIPTILQGKAIKDHHYGAYTTILTTDNKVWHSFGSETARNQWIKEDIAPSRRAWIGNMVTITDDRRFEGNPGDGSHKIMILLGEDGLYSEHSLNTSYPNPTNVFAGFDMLDVKKLVFGARQFRIANDVIVQSSSNPRKFTASCWTRERLPNGTWGDSNPDQSLIEFTVGDTPLEWIEVEGPDESIAATDLSTISIMYLRADGSVWLYQVRFPTMRRDARREDRETMMAPPGAARTDILTIGGDGPEPEGGWGLNWGNHFGG